jgi:hypothetical protein
VPPPLIDAPRDLLVDIDGDLVVTDGDLHFARGLTGIAQECRIAVRTFAEEWFLDLDAGIRYFQSILVRGNPDVIALVAKKEYRDQLLAIDGVTGIEQLDAAFDSATRTLSVTWQVSTALGNTPVDRLSVIGTGGVI